MKGLLLFVGVWTAVKAGMEIVAHNPVWLKESLILGARLSVLVLVGLSLAALTSRVQVGRAVSSLFRPVFRDRSWQGAMSLALMIHFIPVTMGTMHSVQRTLSLRGHGLSVRQRLHLFVTTVMRNLSRSTWDQTMALAVRGLEEQKAWQQHQAFRVKEWIAGGVLGVSIWILSGF
jgi:biotin transport system permease protein